MSNILTSWKTSLQSILTAVIGLSAVAPSISWLTPKQAASLVTAGVVAKVILGMFQTDAGIVLATTPGDPAPKAVPAHESPNDPTATPVVK